MNEMVDQQQITNLDRRLIRLEEAFVRQEQVMERLVHAVERKPTPWNAIFAGTSVVITLMIAILVGFWTPLASDIDKHTKAIEKIQDQVLEMRSNRYTSADHDVYAQDIAEWQRRQDDQILDLYKREAQIAAKVESE